MQTDPPRPHLLDAGSPVEIFRGHSVPTEVSRPASVNSIPCRTRVPTTADPRQTALAGSSWISVFGHPPELLLLSGYCPATVRQIPITAHEAKHVSAGQSMFAIKCQLVPLSVATKETKKAA